MPRFGLSDRQTIEIGVTGSHQNAAAGHRRDDAACRRERQTVILLPAASFATPSFVFADPTARISAHHRRERMRIAADLKVCTTTLMVRLKADTTYKWKTL